MSIAGPSPNDDDGDDILAAEYVLGVLPEDQHRMVALRVAGEPAFARLVERWEHHLSMMNDGFEPVEPPLAVKAALDRRLFVSSAERQATAAGGSRGLWSSLTLWRSLAAASLAALLLVLAVPYLAPPTGPAERLVASLAPQESDVHYFVVYDERAADVALSHVSGEHAEGRDFELWVIADGKPPASIGVIPAGSAVHIGVDDALRRKIAAGAVFAISLEPAGGSPTGQPTGPVVAAGDLRNI